MLAWRPRAGKLQRADLEPWAARMPEGSHRLKPEWLEGRYSHLDPDGTPLLPDLKGLDEESFIALQAQEEHAREKLLQDGDALVLDLEPSAALEGAAEAKKWQHHPAERSLEIALEDICSQAPRPSKLEKKHGSAVKRNTRRILQITKRAVSAEVRQRAEVGLECGVSAAMQHASLVPQVLSSKKALKEAQQRSSAEKRQEAWKSASSAYRERQKQAGVAPLATAPTEKKELEPKLRRAKRALQAALQERKQAATASKKPDCAGEPPGSEPPESEALDREPADNSPPERPSVGKLVRVIDERAGKLLFGRTATVERYVGDDVELSGLQFLATTTLRADFVELARPPLKPKALVQLWNGDRRRWFLESGLLQRAERTEYEVSLERLQKAYGAKTPLMIGCHEIEVFWRRLSWSYPSAPGVVLVPPGVLELWAQSISELAEESAQRWRTALENLYEDAELLLAPVFAEAHWALLAIDKKAGTVRYYDSLACCSEACLRTAQKLLRLLGWQEHQEPATLAGLRRNRAVQEQLDCGFCTCWYLREEVHHFLSGSWACHGWLNAKAVKEYILKTMQHMQIHFGHLLAALLEDEAAVQRMLLEAAEKAKAAAQHAEKTAVMLEALRILAAEYLGENLPEGFLEQLVELPQKRSRLTSKAPAPPAPSPAEPPSPGLPPPDLPAPGSPAPSPAEPPAPEPPVPAPEPPAPPPEPPAPGPAEPLELRGAAPAAPVAAPRPATPRPAGFRCLGHEALTFAEWAEQKLPTLSAEHQKYCLQKKAQGRFVCGRCQYYYGCSSCDWRCAVRWALSMELGGLKLEGYEYRSVASKLAGAPRQLGGGGCSSRRLREEPAEEPEPLEEGFADAAVQTDPWIPRQWGLETVPVLRAELARRGLRTGGLKAELVQRLAVDDAVGILNR